VSATVGAVVGSPVGALVGVAGGADVGVRLAVLRVTVVGAAIVVAPPLEPAARLSGRLAGCNDKTMIDSSIRSISRFRSDAVFRSKSVRYAILQRSTDQACVAPFRQVLILFIVPAITFHLPALSLAPWESPRRDRVCTHFSNTPVARCSGLLAHDDAALHLKGRAVHVLPATSARRTLARRAQSSRPNAPFLHAGGRLTGFMNQRTRMAGKNTIQCSSTSPLRRLL
jgi:hypothetical protein